MKNRITSLLLTLVLVLPGTLSAVSLLSPAPVQAAGVTTHYNYESTTSSKTVNGVKIEAWQVNHDQLYTNVTYGANANRSAALAIYSGTMYLPEGPSGTKLFRIINSIGPVYGKNGADTSYHYGLPGRVWPNSSGTSYYTAPADSLEFELQSLDPINTSKIAAANLSMVITQHDNTSGLDIPFARRLEVKVSVDGQTWLDGSAGVRSAKLIAGGLRNNNGADPTSALFFRIETDDLLSIPGVAGNTIRRIKVLPEGEDTCSGGHLYINELQVNTYNSVGLFNELAPADVITTTPVDGNTLREIAVNEALRVANTQWTTDSDFFIVSPNGSSVAATGTNAHNYYTNSVYRGPAYERGTDASRELFLSLLDDGKYSAEEAHIAESTLKVGNNTHTYTHPYGMDCQTFVFNAISRVSRTSASSVSGTPSATRVSLVGNLNALPFPSYTDQDIVDQNTTNQIYTAYSKAQPGDIAIHFLTDDKNSVHTRLVRSVTVKNYSSYLGGGINPYSSYITFTEQAGGEPKSFNGYYSASRTENTVSFYELRNDGYVIYTLDEYQTGQV